MVTIVQPKLPRVKFFAREPGTRYQPSNGSEGEYFISMWCEECARDKVTNGEVTQEQADANPDWYCTILNESFGADGVAEWVVGEDGQPRCTAFVPFGEPIPYRCPQTADMFDRPNDAADLTSDEWLEIKRMFAAENDIDFVKLKPFEHRCDSFSYSAFPGFVK